MSVIAELKRELGTLRTEVQHLRERMRLMWNALQTTTSGGIRQTVLTFPGVLGIGRNNLRIYNETGQDWTITKVKLSCDTTPGGQAIIVDVHKEGTTIFTDPAHRPAIEAGAYEGETVLIDTPLWADGEYVQAYLDQVGSTALGADVVVHIIHN